MLENRASATSEVPSIVASSQSLAPSLRNRTRFARSSPAHLLVASVSITRMQRSPPATIMASPTLCFAPVIIYLILVVPAWRRISPQNSGGRSQLSAAVSDTIKTSMPVHETHSKRPLPAHCVGQVASAAYQPFSLVMVCLPRIPIPAARWSCVSHRLETRVFGRVISAA